MTEPRFTALMRGAQPQAPRPEAEPRPRTAETHAAMDAIMRAARGPRFELENVAAEVSAALAAARARAQPPGA